MYDTDIELLIGLKGLEKLGFELGYNEYTTEERCHHYLMLEAEGDITEEEKKEWEAIKEKAAKGIYAGSKTLAVRLRPYKEGNLNNPFVYHLHQRIDDYLRQYEDGVERNIELPKLDCVTWLGDNGHLGLTIVGPNGPEVQKRVERHVTLEWDTESVAIVLQGVDQFLTHFLEKYSIQVELKLIGPTCYAFGETYVNRLKTRE